MEYKCKYDKFFEKIVGGDKKRKKFWKKYLNNIYRIEYFESASKALVMEFDNHIFVEFAEPGNACYYYNKNEMNINKIKSTLNVLIINNSQKVRYLKQGVDKINHSGDWQYKFEYRIKKLGYNKSRWS